MAHVFLMQRLHLFFFFLQRCKFVLLSSYVRIQNYMTHIQVFFLCKKKNPGFFIFWLILFLFLTKNWFEFLDDFLVFNFGILFFSMYFWFLTRQNDYCIFRWCYVKFWGFLFSFFLCMDVFLHFFLIQFTRICWLGL